MQHNKYLLLGCLLLFRLAVWAQTQDTIFVYEYEYVTDTLWVDEEQINRDTMQYVALNSKNTTINFNETASQAETLIIEKQEKDQYSMKKTTFITLLFLSLQHLSFAQPELNLKAGMNNYWMNPNSYFSSAIFICDNYGVELKLPLENSKLALSVGYEQHGYFFGADAYYIIHHPGNVDEADYSIPDYRSIPFLCYYKYAGLDLFAGYEFKMNSFQNGDNWNEHAFVTGFDYAIGRKLAFSTKLYFGGLLNKDAFPTNRILSRRNILFSLKYNLFWRNKYAANKG